MGIAEEPSDEFGTWFADYDEQGTEVFSGRLVGITNELQIAWTVDVRKTSTYVAEIQALLEAPIRTVTGTASNGIEQVIKCGRLNTGLHAAHLSRVVGGIWTIRVARRTSDSEVWDVIASREED